MGFFGTFLYDGSGWSEWSFDADEIAEEPWLLVRIHDSDIAEVHYAPSGDGSGVAFMGCTPRIYFEDESASAPTDPEREARGLAAWWAGLHPDAGESARAAKVTELQAFLASDIPPPEDDEDLDVEDLDEEEVFVELKAAHFYRAAWVAGAGGARRVDLDLDAIT